MKDENLLGPWVRRFLLEHLVADRNLSRNTQASYRDALTLLLPFVSKQLASLSIADRLNTCADVVRHFLGIWKTTGTARCHAATNGSRRSIRLPASLGCEVPSHLAWCAEIPPFRFKKAAKTTFGTSRNPRWTPC